MILNVFKVLIHAYNKKNALLMFLFMFIIVLSVTIVCYPENFALIFKSCAIYLYLCFKI